MEIRTDELVAAATQVTAGPNAGWNYLAGGTMPQIAWGTTYVSPDFSDPTSEFARLNDGKHGRCTLSAVLAEVLRHEGEHYKRFQQRWGGAFISDWLEEETAYGDIASFQDIFRSLAGRWQKEVDDASFVSLYEEMQPPFGMNLDCEMQLVTQ